MEVLTRAPDDLAGRLVDDLLARLRVSEACRPHSPNYAGDDTIATARSAFARQGWHLDNEGHLAPTVVGDVRYADRRPAIEAQIARVRNAPGDAAGRVPWCGGGEGVTLSEVAAGYPAGSAGVTSSRIVAVSGFMDSSEK